MTSRADGWEVNVASRVVPRPSPSIWIGTGCSERKEKPAWSCHRTMLDRVDGPVGAGQHACRGP